MGTTRQRLAVRVVALVLGVAAVFAVAPVRPASAADGDWACSVPAGYTYDRMDRYLQCGSGYIYHLRVPADGLWACTVSEGFTHDRADLAFQCNPRDSRATIYHIRRPVSGLWACSVPPGFSYDATYMSYDCRPFSYQTMYRLRR
jgi:hypothetical protein